MCDMEIFYYISITRYQNTKFITNIMLHETHFFNFTRIFSLTFRKNPINKQENKKILFCKAITFIIFLITTNEKYKNFVLVNIKTNKENKI